MVFSHRVGLVGWVCKLYQVGMCETRFAIWSLCLILFCTVDAQTTVSPVKVGLIVVSETTERLAEATATVKMGLEQTWEGPQLEYVIQGYTYGASPVGCTCCAEFGRTSGEAMRAAGVVAVIEGSCSTTSAAMSSVLSEHPRILQMSYRSTLPSLSNLQLYPSFRRVVPSDEGVTACYAGIIRKFQWESVGIVTQSNSDWSSFLNASTSARIEQTLPPGRAYITYSAVSLHDSDARLDAIMATSLTQTNVHFLAMGPTMAKRVLASRERVFASVRSKPLIIGADSAVIQLNQIPPPNRTAIILPAYTHSYRTGKSGPFHEGTNGALVCNTLIENTEAAQAFKIRYTVAFGSVPSDDLPMYAFDAGQAVGLAMSMSVNDTTTGTAIGNDIISIDAPAVLEAVSRLRFMGATMMHSFSVNDGNIQPTSGSESPNLPVGNNDANGRSDIGAVDPNVAFQVQNIQSDYAFSVAVGRMTLIDRDVILPSSVETSTASPPPPLKVPAMAFEMGSRIIMWPGSVEQTPMSRIVRIAVLLLDNMWSPDDSIGFISSLATVNNRFRHEWAWSIRFVHQEFMCPEPCGDTEVVSLGSHLIAARFDVAVSSLYSGSSKTLAPVLDKGGILLISSINTLAVLSDRVAFPLFRRISVNDPTFAQIWLSAIRRYGWGKVLVVHSEGAYELGMVLEINRLCSQYGITVVTISVSGKEIDWSLIAERLASSGASCFMSILYQEPQFRLMSAMEPMLTASKGSKVLIVVNEVLSDVIAFSTNPGARRVADNVMAIKPWVGIGSPAWNEYRSDVLARYPDVSESHLKIAVMAYDYDTVSLVGHAVAHGVGGSSTHAKISGREIAEWTQSVSFQGASRWIEFGSDNTNDAQGSAGAIVAELVTYSNTIGEPLRVGLATPAPVVAARSTARAVAASAAAGSPLGAFDIDISTSVVSNWMAGQATPPISCVAGHAVRLDSAGLIVHGCHPCPPGTFTSLSLSTSCEPCASPTHCPLASWMDPSLVGDADDLAGRGTFVFDQFSVVTEAKPQDKRAIVFYTVPIIVVAIIVLTVNIGAYALLKRVHQNSTPKAVARSQPTPSGHTGLSEHTGLVAQRSRTVGSAYHNGMAILLHWMRRLDGFKREHYVQEPQYIQVKGTVGGGIITSWTFCAAITILAYVFNLYANHNIFLLSVTSPGHRAFLKTSTDTVAPHLAFKLSVLFNGVDNEFACPASCDGFVTHGKWSSVIDSTTCHFDETQRRCVIHIEATPDPKRMDTISDIRTDIILERARVHSIFWNLTTIWGQDQTDPYFSSGELQPPQGALLMGDEPTVLSCLLKPTVLNLLSGSQIRGFVPFEMFSRTGSSVTAETFADGGVGGSRFVSAIRFQASTGDSTDVFRQAQQRTAVEAAATGMAFIGSLLSVCVILVRVWDRLAYRWTSSSSVPCLQQLELKDNERDLTGHHAWPQKATHDNQPEQAVGSSFQSSTGSTYVPGHPSLLVPEEDAAYGDVSKAPQQDRRASDVDIDHRGHSGSRRAPLANGPMPRKFLSEPLPHNTNAVTADAGSNNGPYLAYVEEGVPDNVSCGNGQRQDMQQQGDSTMLVSEFC